ncbi:hypothetical protein VFPFJ_11587 [Purpureocillium lilacinum]|uniref:Uncharacterized protein n=1 Tax=Purpureocillium lilacinum TaxID=33203 RepID=A0A179F2G9_PURLI|nr:hypothetical protein VFPFJ_11587 [Purpureocillium lilacinum]OAQ59289.1 hypothetical protein VFPFJ_11587 [Purpureocillium lilacinum]
MASTLCHSNIMLCHTSTASITTRFALSESSCLRRCATIRAESWRQLTARSYDWYCPRRESSLVVGYLLTD